MYADKEKYMNWDAGTIHSANKGQSAAGASWCFKQYWMVYVFDKILDMVYIRYYFRAE